MKKFEEFNNGNVTEVKSAIANGKATVIMYCSCGIKNCFKGIIEKNDIYSLYDHQSLIIVREGDFIRVCQLKKFYKKNSDDYVVIIEKVGPVDILDKLKDAGIEDGPMYDSVNAIFDKAIDLKRKLEESKEKEEEEEEAAPDDIFDILNGKVKKTKDADTNIEDELAKINPFEMLAKLLVGTSVMHSSFDELMKDPKNAELYRRAKNFKKEKGKLPSYEEFINMDSSLTDEEKEELIKRHRDDDNPIGKLNDLLRKISDSVDDNMKKK